MGHDGRRGSQLHRLGRVVDRPLPRPVSDGRGILLQSDGGRAARHRRPTAADMTATARIAKSRPTPRIGVDRQAAPLLAIEDLSIEFRTRSGTVRALDRVGVTLGRGETLALVGESGSGKSVTAYAVMGILDAAARVTGGRIVFGGLDMLAASNKVLDEVRGREAAIIFQNPRAALNPIVPVGPQIADVLLRHGNLTRAQAPEPAIEMPAKVRIPHPNRRSRPHP